MVCSHRMRFVAVRHVASFFCRIPQDAEPQRTASDVNEPLRVSQENNVYAHVEVIV